MFPPLDHIPQCAIVAGKFSQVNFMLADAETTSSLERRFTTIPGSGSSIAQIMASIICAAIIRVSGGHEEKLLAIISLGSTPAKLCSLLSDLTQNT